MAFTEDSQNTAIDAMTAMGDRISLHNGDTGITGANEVTTAGTRLTTVWPAASGGQSVGSECNFVDQPAGAYSHYGVWTAGGVFLWGFPLNPSVTLNGVGDIDVTPTLTF